MASTEEDEASTKEKLVNLKEIDRLHYHVRSIENDCHIVPMGALRLNSKHEVQRSENFLGLPPSEVFDLKCYSHFRNVQNKDKKAKLEADDAVFQRNFLDDVDCDLPVGVWSIQKDGSKSKAMIRNNLWKGYTAWHR